VTGAIIDSVNRASVCSPYDKKKAPMKANNKER